mgnify:CR=1 FL=1
MRRLIESEEMFKYSAMLVALVIFLIFFALAPLHALMLFGLMIILSTVAFGDLESSTARLLIIIGTLMMVLAIAALFVPKMLQGLLVASWTVRRSLSVIGVS